MGEVIEKLQDKIIDRLLPICQSLRDQGLTDLEIQGFVRNYHKHRSFDFYKEKNIKTLPQVIQGVIGGIEKADSKIEKKLYEIFADNGIDFKFQYKIGAYRADYLLWGFLVVELDGPQHELQKDHDKKRDQYLKKMGYQVLRIPTWVLIEEPEEVLKLVLGFKPKEKIKKPKKKKRSTSGNNV